MIKLSQKFLIGILVFVILLNPLSGLVNKSQAQLTTGQVTGKALAAGAACFLAIKIEQYAETYKDKVEGAANSSTGSLTGAADTVTSVPVHDKSTNITTIQEIGASAAKQKTSVAIDMSKKCVRDTVVKIYMDWIVDQTITWIQGGGKPQFVQNWNSFLKDAADTGVGEVVRESGLAFLCEPFKLRIKLSLYPVQRFKQNISCTLDKIVKNINNFMDDFQNGSWIGYGSLWQPNNNYFGQVLLTYDEASARASAKKEASQNEAMASGGFLSTQKCIQKNQDEVNSCLVQCMDDPTVCNIPTDITTEAFCNEQATCSKYEATTPGSIIGSVVAKSVTNDMDWMNNVQSWTAALANAAINRLITGGLAYMAGTGAGSDSYTGADFSKDNSSGSTNASSTAEATDQLLENIKGIKDNVINNEQAIYDIKSNTYQQMQWTYGIYTACIGVSPAGEPSKIVNLLGAATSTLIKINDSYLIPNSGFQITVDKLLVDFMNTSLTASDLQKKYDAFVNNYKSEIKDVNSGAGKTAANKELTVAEKVLADTKIIAKPLPAVPVVVPPDPTVNDPTSACGKAYADSSKTL